MVEAVNAQEGSERKVGRLNKLTMGLLAGITLFGPTVNAVATDGAKSMLFDERVAAQAEEASSGAKQIEDLIERGESGQGDVDDSGEDALSRAVFEQLTALQVKEGVFGALRSIDEEALPWVEMQDVSTDRRRMPFHVHLNGNETMEFELEAARFGGSSVDDVGGIINEWLQRETDRYVDVVAEDRAVQDEIDRRRGK